MRNSLSDLAVFSAVAEEGSFTGAVARLTHRPPLTHRLVSGQKELLMARMKAKSLSLPDQFAAHIRGEMGRKR